jgi:hypothetical protein
MFRILLFASLLDSPWAGGRCVCGRTGMRWRGLAQPVWPGVLALHECDHPLCVKVSPSGEGGQAHVVAGTQRDNMVRSIPPEMLCRQPIAGR